MRWSTLSLLLANAVTLVVALALRWPVATLMWPYWVQSVIIGYFSWKRIRVLRRFSDQGLRLSDEQARGIRRETAEFFTVHYGGFHVLYLAFLWMQTARLLDGWDWLGLVVLAISFAWNHRFSFQRNIEADRRGTPELATLMFLPYARIVPMHLTIVLGDKLGGGGVATMLLFGVLKTGADVLMHEVEHRVLRGGAAPAASARPSTPS